MRVRSGGLGLQWELFGGGSMMVPLSVEAYTRSQISNQEVVMAYRWLVVPLVWTSYETVSILKFIETRWGLPPLDARDRQAVDLTLAFEF
jgi:hypothetical protein